MSNLANLRELPKSELASKLAGMRNRMSRTREQAREKTKMVVGALVGGASAYGSGYLAKNYPEHMTIGETEIPTLAAAATVLFAAGAVDAAGDQSTYLVDAGRGMGDAFLALKGYGAL